MKRHRLTNPWIHFAKHLIISFSAGVFLIPLFRKNPEQIHVFVTRLDWWQRVLFTFLTAVLISSTALSIFSPSKNDITNARKHPPTWLAWILSLLLLSIIDLTFGLSKKGYSASLSDWIFFCLIPLGTSWLFREIQKNSNNSEAEILNRRGSESKDTEDAAIKSWLNFDKPSCVDYFDTFGIAKRMLDAINNGVTAIGLVGNFGSGKSTVIEAFRALLTNSNRSASPHYILVSHSCWGFESSTSSIREIIASAVSEADDYVDTYYIRSLPENYLKSITSEINWIEGIAKPIFGSGSHLDQLQRLSDALIAQNAKLIVVIEDIDRNSSTKFELQEIEGFLFQLKGYAGICFIVAGGTTSDKQISYSKLCDSIEYILNPTVEDVRKLVLSFRDLCRKEMAKNYTPIDSELGYMWNELGWFSHERAVNLGLADAFIKLAKTPREIKHALRLTYNDWTKMCGEVHIDDLIVANLLRTASPPCFQFLIDNWYYLCEPPKPEDDNVRKQISKTWQLLSDRSEFDSVAATRLIKEILPSFGMWVNLKSTVYPQTEKPQGLTRSKYWRRIVKRDIGGGEVKDQQVVRDLEDWIVKPTSTSEVILQLTYWDVGYHESFRTVSKILLNRSDLLLVFASHLLERIRITHAANAGECMGLSSIVRVTSSFGSSVAYKQWLMREIELASNTSLSLVNWILHRIASFKQPNKKLEGFEYDQLRDGIIKHLQKKELTTKMLSAIIPAHDVMCLTYFLFPTDVGRCVSDGFSQQWQWLSKLLIACMKDRDANIAIQVAQLLTKTDGNYIPIEPRVCDMDVFCNVFHDSGNEALISLRKCIDNSMTEEQKLKINAIVESIERNLT
jgi:hypothetical protein